MWTAKNTSNVHSATELKPVKADWCVYIHSKQVYTYIACVNSIKVDLYSKCNIHKQVHQQVFGHKSKFWTCFMEVVESSVLWGTWIFVPKIKMLIYFPQGWFRKQYKASFAGFILHIYDQLDNLTWGWCWRKRSFIFIFGSFTVFFLLPILSNQFMSSIFYVWLLSIGTNLWALPLLKVACLLLL